MSGIRPNEWIKDILTKLGGSGYLAREFERQTTDQKPRCDRRCFLKPRIGSRTVEHNVYAWPLRVKES